MSARLSGFAKLREGKIHLRCYSCGRKMSNQPRYDDPPRAVLMETPCSECCFKHAMKEPETNYFDAKGRQIA